MTDLTPSEHPFAQYVRILGKGKSTSRSLSQEEATLAFAMILNGEVEDVQLGAFLLLLRVKGESAEEMAGFSQASRDFIHTTNTIPDSTTVDIDWPSYAGKHKQQHWYLLAAQLLADSGYRIFMHGCAHHTAGRIYTQDVLSDLAIPTCHDWETVDQQLDKTHFAFMPLEQFCLPIATLFQQRSLLGVRSPAHSFVKLINPLKANTSLQSVFHPAYLEVHQQAAELMGYTQNLGVKGEGGEIEFRPDADNKLFLLHNSDITIETWPRRLTQRQSPVGLDRINPQALKDLWRGSSNSNGNEQSDYGLQAVIGTAAMVLLAHAVVSSEKEAWQLAEHYWQQRNKERF